LAVGLTLVPQLMSSGARLMVTFECEAGAACAGAEIPRSPKPTAAAAMEMPNLRTIFMIVSLAVSWARAGGPCK
jgi:hypothetical protein